ncbi:MAG: bifunctional phosphoribosylaminoimidazolecarboxamide formyltransferase/IMP cyclohydrolase PurH [Planctomycetota bacterium]|nr:MAG: bifunctional phosphoribosylaminoimidazolecarboxamide formyltransferase/IMP cyclohydrolase PurH [Planctomycetota bacterium]HAQ67691.1 bifunctional phosphoribosylaminoimidazolecarboxamide formyltransferase/inosine monophosphate cyclohydrolase [Phycisphaerales bacterium]
MSEHIRIRRALISVSDKSGLVEFARELAAMGVEIISTGGTAAALAKAGIAVLPIESVTGFPEMMDGRVKTLHPKVHGGLLGVRNNPEHVAAMTAHSIAPIDLVCVNLYPFEATVAKPGIAEHDAIENIDIGGPSMLRSAAKNFESVTVVTDGAQYPRVIAEMRANAGATTMALRRECAQAVFARTAEYDGAIARWMSTAGFAHAAIADADAAPIFPRQANIRLELADELRYGENPHQRGAVYADRSFTGPSVVGAQLLHGKPLSYNNLLDAAAALELVQDLHAQRPACTACAVIKHTNPCGAAIADSVLAAFEHAWSGDPMAAFGGIVAFSSTVDVATAEAMAAGERFLEVVIAPGYEPKALETLQARWKNARLLATSHASPTIDRALTWRSIPGGMLVQERDVHRIDAAQFTHAAGPVPSAATLADAALMFAVAKHLKSNAVCIGANGTLFGAGAGQMDRVASCRNAVEKAKAKLAAMAAGTVAVAASDAFFPFADGPALLADAGVRCIVHPGGSKRDQDTFDLCNARGITCLLTGSRHFRH